VFINDELCDYVLFFRGDIKREIHLSPKDNDFKALLYQQRDLQGTMLDLFTIYVTVEKTCCSKTLLYCTQLDCADIRFYAHR
jgi:hypothetical protein